MTWLGSYRNITRTKNQALTDSLLKMHWDFKNKTKNFKHWWHFWLWLLLRIPCSWWGGIALRRKCKINKPFFFFLSFKSFLGNICKREMQLLILPFFLTFYYRICLLFHVFDLNSAVTSWLQIHTHGEELTVYSFFKKWKGMLELTPEW